MLIWGFVGSALDAVLVHSKQVETVDKAIMLRLQAVRDPRFERAMVAISWLGFPPQSRVLPPTYAAVLWILRFRLEAVLQLAAWGSALLSTIVKAVVRRPRPAAGRGVQVVAARLDGSSFPSGHVLSYVAIYGWMAIMANQLIRPLLLRRVVVAALSGLIALVGPSRIYLGHHWPSDVAASYAIGASYLAALLLAYRRLTSRRVPA